MLLLSIIIFIGSCTLLAIAGGWLVNALSRIAHFLGWREFIVSFFLMSFATSIPELSVGISAALQGIPELSFGNIVGQNIIHFTLAIALCAFILGTIDIESKTVGVTALYTFMIALMPLFFIMDGNLSRADGVILILSFLFYSAWIFSKKQHFTRTYEHHVEEAEPALTRAKTFFKDVGAFILGSALLAGSSQGIIWSSAFFSEAFGFPLVVVGVIIVGIGTALPETYFSIASALRKNAWMLIGNLMGATVVSSSIVLGTVALIRPIDIPDLSPYLVSRAFLIASAIFFIIFLRTGRHLTRKEGIALLLLYLAFLATEVIVNAG